MVFEYQNKSLNDSYTKMKLIQLKLFLLMFNFQLLVGWAIGQTVIIDGEIRPRTEFKDGYKLLAPAGADAAFSVSQRTRFNAFYGSKEFNAYISMQDIRVWGDVNQLDKGNFNSFGIHQAWGEYFFNEDFSFKVGRQELVYDDSRIFGNVGWAQQARAHDLGLFKYEKNNFKLHLGLAFNQKTDVLFGTDYYASLLNGSYTLNANYKTMQFLWFHTKLGDAGLSLLFLNNGMESVTPVETINEFKTLYSQTIGARFTPTAGSVKFAAAFYYQMGNIDSDTTSLSASYFALEGSVKPYASTTISAGFEYLSGTSLKDKMEQAGELYSFTPLYGTNHKFNGHMDYFYVGNHANNVGLVDIYATLKYTVKYWSFFATPHYFMAAADVFAAKGTTSPDFILSEYDNMSKGLGLEIDLGLTYAPQKNMEISIGLSEMFGTETLGFIQGYSSAKPYSKNGSWAYLMFIFKPTFFSAN